MTTERTIESRIIELEAKLAALTKPCKCLCGCHTDIWDRIWIGCCDDIHEGHTPKSSTCTGVVPLIAGSRRECPDNMANCNCCGGLDYVPDLDGMKVLSWMVKQGSLFHEPTSDGFKALWRPRNKSGVLSIRAEGVALELVLLRVCLEGAEAMEASDDNDTH